MIKFWPTMAVTIHFFYQGWDDWPRDKASHQDCLVAVNSSLFGGLNPSEKYDFVSWDDEIPNRMEQ